MNKKNFCPLPWTHLFVGTTGYTRLCCTASTRGASHRELINNKSFNSARLKLIKDERPTECYSYCYSKEDNGGTSKRQGYLQEDNPAFISYEEAVSRTMQDGSIERNIYDLDLRIGNTCDLACVMCGSINSSKWAELEKNINIKTGMERSHSVKWWENKDFWNDLHEILLHAKLVKFGGGEPLLLKQHKDVLKFLKENNPNCIIKYITNANNITQEYIDLWQDIPNLYFTFSLDSINERIEYLRWPVKWDSIIENLLMLKQLKNKPLVAVNYTMSLFNILYINEDLNYFLPKLNEFGIDDLHLNHVHHPNFLHAGLLPDNIKSNIHINNDRYEREVQSYLSSSTYNEKLLKKFSAYANDLDTARGTNVLKAFPKLINIL